MNPTNPTRPSLRPLHIVALTGLFLLIAGVVGVAGYFRLSSETTLLRQSVMKSVPGPWFRSTIQVRWGAFPPVSQQKTISPFTQGLV